ncbi:choice-of-anchor I family protein [Evtepia sp.]
MNHRGTKRGAALLLAGLLSVGLVPSALAAQDDTPALEKIAGYSTGYSDQEGGVAEIVAYSQDNQKFYLVNGREQKLDIVSLAGLTAGEEGQSLTLEQRLDVSQMIPGFAFGDLTSVAVDPVHDRVAVAVQAEDYAAKGAILLLNYDGEYLAHYPAGVQPDNVTFSPDGRYVLSANEGEPRQGYENGTDPQGSVTIVDLAAETPAPNTVTFEAFDAQREALTQANVILKQGRNPSTDLEPEYIAVDGDSATAYVALQEANSIAVLDLASGQFTGVHSLGFKDHSQPGNELDANKEDKQAKLQNEAFMGVYMPDGIALYEAGGKTFLLTANEGDASEWEEYANITTVVTGTVEEDGETTDVEVEVLDKTKLDGLPAVEEGTHFTLGGRSFSLYEVTQDGLTQVFDSGSDFESITAQAYPDHFNASNKNNKLDSRSDAKGPEPESVTVNLVEGKPYAYVGLERIGGVMVYDLSDPAHPAFVEYVNTRDFSVDFPEAGTDPAQGDVSVEGMCAVPASASPTGQALLLTANEVSGTVAVFQHSQQAEAPAELPFTDVAQGAWYYDAVAYAYENGLMAGMGNDLFVPNGTTTRAQLVTILHRLEGAPALPDTALDYPFSDVAADSWYGQAVYWAREKGIVKGVSDTAFGPDQALTREQMAAMLHRYAQYKQADLSASADLSGYTDAGQIANYAQAAMAWTNGTGLITGTSATTLSPKGTATRAQAATILLRMSDLFAQA